MFDTVKGNGPLPANGVACGTAHLYPQAPAVNKGKADFPVFP
jgi:hypothetical protein